MHCGKKWWIREFVAPYIFPLNPDYVAARSLRSLRSNNWAFIFKIIRVRIIDTFSFRKSEETHLAPLTHLAKHAILAEFSGLNLKSGSHLLALLHIIV